MTWLCSSASRSAIGRSRDPPGLGCVSRIARRRAQTDESGQNFVICCRASGEEALDLVAAGSGEPSQLRRRFDAFGDHRQVQPGCHRDGGVHERSDIVDGGDRCDETSIEFQ